MFRKALCLVPFCLLAAGQEPASSPDPRTFYDVDTYRLDLQVDPASRSYSGTVAIFARVTGNRLDVFEIDLMRRRRVTGARLLSQPLSPTSSLVGKAMEFTQDGDRVRCRLPAPILKGGEVRVALDYEGGPNAFDDGGGISMAQTPDGKPWITTSCQVLGAHSWWPCKNDNEFPADKFAHLFMNVTVPRGLTAVCNGRLTGRNASGDLETFQWRHDYPCENYAVALNVGPYVELSGELNLKGLPKPVPYSFFVLPQDLEKAQLQFSEVPRLLDAYGEAFGPFPFPESKFCLVQTPFWGMEHSTVVAYGNSWPAWLERQGKQGEDPWAPFNVFFDYILIHEVAHEWWGNAVSASDWGHLWIHEGFGTYSEAVYVEKVYGRGAADSYLATLRPKISPRFRTFRGKGVLPSQAFDNNVYYKGAWVLNTLRTFVDDDAAWWRALREFNLRFRYKNAATEDFQKVLEEVTGKPWGRFFQEWFYGDSYPLLIGSVKAAEGKIVAEISNPPQFGQGYHVPLELRWQEGGRTRTERRMLEPGENRLEIATSGRPQGLQVLNLNRILCDAKIVVER
jgi:aminopeptidase N